MSFAAGSLARGMKSPTTKDLEELKRVGRHFRGRPAGAIVYESQTLPGVLEVFCDADHAGDLGTRKSRSRMAVMWRAHLIKHESAGSGESEYALLRSSARSGIQAPLNDWRYGVECEVLQGQVCSTRTGENSTCWCASCGYNQQCRKDV